MTACPYYDPDDAVDTTWSYLVGTGLADLRRCLDVAAMAKWNGDETGRIRAVTATVQWLAEHHSPELLAQMLVVDEWDAAMARARHLREQGINAVVDEELEDLDGEIAGLLATSVPDEPSYVGRHGAHDAPHNPDTCRQCRRRGGVR